VIVTLKVQLAPKLEVQLTAVVPTGKNEPDGGEQAGGLELHIPIVDGEKFTLAPVPHLLRSLLLVMLWGQLSAQLQDGDA